MRVFVMLVSLALTPLLCVAALAQSAPNPVREHFLAYRAALEAGDLSSAEAAGAAALSASEARDGDGGRTAVLAFNLAALRLDTGKGAEALTLARRAQTLAQARPDAGVDPVLAGLLVGRAEIAADVAGEAPILIQDIPLAIERGASTSDVYVAALALVDWALGHQRYDVLAQAWAGAAVSAEGSGGVVELARAEALTGEGAAIFMHEASDPRRRDAGVLVPRDGGRRNAYARLSEDGLREAHSKFHQARQLLWPLIEHDLATGELTPAQRAYAQALVWDGALIAKALSEGHRRPREPGEAEGDADGLAELQNGAAGDARPRCLVQLRPPRIRYPDDAYGQLGAVAVRLVVNEAGEVVSEDVVARAGSELLADAVGAARGWRVSRREDSEPECRMAMVVLLSVNFMTPHH